jgi:4-hydroxy-tetrahydrodipicolinate synthase
MPVETLRESLEQVAFTTPVPFTDDTNEVDYDALAANLSALEGAGARLFVPCGNTGEYYALTDNERIGVVETHVEATSDDATIVAGAGGSIGEVKKLADAYEAANADALLLMHPTHTYIHRKGLTEYYHRICDATDLGLVIYKRGSEVHRDVLVELSEREDVVGVKFAHDDIKEFSQTVEDGADEVTWLNGIAERYALAFAIEGATGFTTGIGNFLPETTLELFDALRAGNWERAREIQRALRPFEDLREEAGVNNDLPAANNVPVVKRGLELAGHTGGPVRPPLVGLTDEDEDRLKQYYEAIADRSD